MVLRHAVLLSHNAADAEDLAQETLLKASRSLQTLKDVSGIQAWLMTIMRNTWTDHWRHRAAEGKVVSLDGLVVEPADPNEPTEPAAYPPPPEDINDPDHLLEWVSDEQLIHGIRRLPDEMRWAILLVDIGGYEYEQTAKMLGVPIGTVRSRLNRGRMILRTFILAERSSQKCKLI